MALYASLEARQYAPPKLNVHFRGVGAESTTIAAGDCVGDATVVLVFITSIPGEGAESFGPDRAVVPEPEEPLTAGRSTRRQGASLVSFRRF